MITVPGTINVRSIPGRFGNFNVGTLECSIGSFTVKDATIEEFDEGSYDGNFVIDVIKPNSYVSGGRLVVEVRAYLNSILLSQDVISHPAKEESLEQDPLEQEMAAAAWVPPDPNDDATPNTESNPLSTTDDSDDETLATLFAELWPLSKVIKLDPSINRATFRQQKDHLKTLGYHFVASKQHWIKD